MPETDHLWQELTVNALLGTQRRAFTPPEASGGLGSALRAAASQPSEDSEALLLRTVALAALHRRAGTLPNHQPVTLPDVCAPDDWPRCAILAGVFLETILRGEWINLLPEWVALATRYRRRIREEHLPLVFGQPKAIQPLRKTLLPVLGERGRWLARRNPEWQSFDNYTSEATWFEGTRKERQAYLEDLRAIQPARARELLAETWGQESPAERVAFLQVLGNGLSMADEPFLEGVLDDRRKDVRAAAAALLGRLPESRMVQRMLARARSLLHWKSGLLRSTLEVSLPEVCDEAMQRDGIDPKPAKKVALGEKSSWLAQILAMTPPGAWSKAWNRSPDQILASIHKHNDEAALYLGWQNAAIAFQDTNWLEALLIYDLRRADRTNQPDLFAQLPTTLQEKHMIVVLRQLPSLAYDQPAAVYLSACRFPWGQELTRVAVQCICAQLQKGDLQPWSWERLLRDIAPYPHPDVLDEAVERMDGALKRRGRGDSAVEKLVAVLRFRSEMQRAFAE